MTDHPSTSSRTLSCHILSSSIGSLPQSSLKAAISEKCWLVCKLLDDKIFEWIQIPIGRHGWVSIFRWLVTLVVWGIWDSGAATALKVRWVGEVLSTSSFPSWKEIMISDDALLGNIVLIFMQCLTLDKSAHASKAIFVATNNHSILWRSEMDESEKSHLKQHRGRPQSTLRVCGLQCNPLASKLWLAQPLHFCKECVLYLCYQNIYYIYENW